LPPASHVDVKRNGKISAWGLVNAVGALRDSQISAAAYMDDCLASIDAQEATVAAFSALDAGQIRHRAYLLDRLPADKRGPLHGIPFGVAAVFDVLNMHCAQGSEIVPERVALADAAIVGKARAAGGTVLGITASAEFGCFGQGQSRNSSNPDRASGGSGAASAVAANMAPLAFDARVDGPISRPAAYCGIYGLTATRGTIVSDGVVSLSPSIESRGFYVRDAEDVGFACRHFLGVKSIPEAREELAYRTPNLAVRVLEGPSSYRIEAAGRLTINRAMTALSDARVDVDRFRLPPHFVKVESCYDILLSYEVARQLTVDRDRFAAKMKAETLALIDHGRRIEASKYEQARRDAIALRSELFDFMMGDTVFLDAATEGTPPLRAEESGSSALHALWAIAGAPVLSVPCGTVDGLPVGVQIAAAPGREDLLARLACIIEDFVADA
jgi:Asp-tRNA(Asn)/Glu-tRNA(Gln) amidotransferase A subunit family amidase